MRDVRRLLLSTVRIWLGTSAKFQLEVLALSLLKTKIREFPRRQSVRIRSFGFHQGQRSAYRSGKAGYMTASSTAVSSQFFPCNTGGVHT